MADRLPVRERILQYIKTLFENATDIGGEPNLMWEAIVRAPLTDKERKTKSCLSLMEGRERKQDRSLVTDKFLDFSVEFEVRTFMGEDPATFLNLVLADIQKTMGEHRQAGGLCLHVEETGSDVDISSGEDRVVGGIVFFVIHYRHMTDDPTRAQGE
jgi:hypothetical protein